MVARSFQHGVDNIVIKVLDSKSVEGLSIIGYFCRCFRCGCSITAYAQLFYREMVETQMVHLSPSYNRHITQSHLA